MWPYRNPSDGPIILIIQIIYFSLKNSLSFFIYLFMYFFSRPLPSRNDKNYFIDGNGKGPDNLN